MTFRSTAAPRHLEPRWPTHMVIISVLFTFTYSLLSNVLCLDTDSSLFIYLPVCFLTTFFFLNLIFWFFFSYVEKQTYFVLWPLNILVYCTCFLSWLVLSLCCFNYLNFGPNKATLDPFGVTLARHLDCIDFKPEIHTDTDPPQKTVKYLALICEIFPLACQISQREALVVK